MPGPRHNASPSDVDFAKFLARTRRRAEARTAEVSAALATSSAIIFTRGENLELVIVSGETQPGQLPLRATTFLVDGPWGHQNYATRAEVADALARGSWDSVRAATEDEIIEWTSTPEFIEGSRRVAYVQAANALRYVASQTRSRQERDRIDDLVRKADRMEDLEAAIEILERELARAGSQPVENPPWVTRVLADAYEDIEGRVPPAWLPKLSDVTARKDRITAAMHEYGCGAYGCVLPTLDPEIVLKITTDETEADFAANLSHTLVVPITVEYHTVLRLAASHKDRPVFLVWRESATDVGRVKEELGEAALDAVVIQHAAAQDVLRAIMRGHGLSDALSVWIDACEQMADQDDIPEIQDIGRGLLRCFNEQRIFFGDVHAGNLGRVNRDGHSEWVITDPGNVIVFK